METIFKTMYSNKAGDLLELLKNRFLGLTVNMSGPGHDGNYDIRINIAYAGIRSHINQFVAGFEAGWEARDKSIG